MIHERNNNITTIQTLPSEIICNIFSNFNPEELKIIKEVNKQWRQLVEQHCLSFHPSLKQINLRTVKQLHYLSSAANLPEKDRLFLQFKLNWMCRENSGSLVKSMDRHHLFMDFLDDRFNSEESFGGGSINLKIQDDLKHLLTRYANINRSIDSELPSEERLASLRSERSLIQEKLEVIQAIQKNYQNAMLLPQLRAAFRQRTIFEPIVDQNRLRMEVLGVALGAVKSHHSDMLRWFRGQFDTLPPESKREITLLLITTLLQGGDTAQIFDSIKEFWDYIPTTDTMNQDQIAAIQQEMALPSAQSVDMGFFPLTTIYKVVIDITLQQWPSSFFVEEPITIMVRSIGEIENHPLRTYCLTQLISSPHRSSFSTTILGEIKQVIRRTAMELKSDLSGDQLLRERLSSLCDEMIAKIA